MLPGFLKTSGDLHADRRYEYAKDLAESGDLESAIDLLTQAAETAPHWPVIPFTLGKLYRQLRSLAKARACFQESLVLDPDDHQGALLEMQLLGAENLTGMPPAFVAGLFDQYAPRFDAHLVDTLKYNVPFQIRDLVSRTDSTFKPKRILDLGCGTGLAALHFANGAEWVEGVDLSEGMLREAERKNIYNKLVCADLLQYLQGNELKFDLIIAADVFTYVGNLNDIFKTIRFHLNPGGAFIFSVQKSPDESHPFTLEESHRYVHTNDYIYKALNDAGLVIAAQEEHILRQDRGIDVPGYIYLCN